MDRQAKINLICAVADETGLDRVELLGGGLAESGINLDKFERYGVWPDVSFGMYQQTVLYADEGDHTDSPENVEYIRGLYADPEHAVRVAAPKYKYWRTNPDVSALQAWSGYNGGLWGYRNYLTGPNRSNYEWGLQKAAEALGAAPATTSRTWGPDVPDELVNQKNDWTCAVRSLYGATWAMAEMGLIPPVTYGDGGPRDVYDLLVPTYDSGVAGLKDSSGAGLVQALKSWGISAGHTAGATLAEVQARAGRQPVLIGGIAWNHWVYVRGMEEDGTLMLENPSPGYKNIRFQLLDSFDRLGPMSMVWIDVPETAPVPAPVPTPAPFSFQFGIKTRAEELGASVVGAPTEDEHGLDERFNIQRTTSGIMIYSKAANDVTFVRG